MKRVAGNWNETRGRFYVRVQLAASSKHGGTQQAGKDELEARRSESRRGAGKKNEKLGDEHFLHIACDLVAIMFRVVYLYRDRGLSGLSRHNLGRGNSSISARKRQVPARQMCQCHIGSRMASQSDSKVARGGAVLGRTEDRQAARGDHQRGWLDGPRGAIGQEVSLITDGKYYFPTGASLLLVVIRAPSSSRLPRNTSRPAGRALKLRILGARHRLLTLLGPAAVVFDANPK